MVGSPHCGGCGVYFLICLWYTCGEMQKTEALSMPHKIIDGHAHLTPRGLIGQRDARIGVTYLPYGELEFDSGERIPYMPELIADTAFPAETLLHVMDSHGIAHAVLMANSLTDLEENVRAVETYPERFSAAMTIPQGPEAVSTVERYADRGLRAIKFEMSEGLGYTHPNMYPDFRLDCPEMDAVYALAGERKITVTVDPSHIGGFAYQVEALDSAASRFPQTHFVICHLGFPDVPMAEGSAHYARWREMIALGRHDNVWFDVAALTDFYREEGFPFPTAQHMVRQVMDELGTAKLLWGSDAPGTLSTVTYQQMLDLYEKSPLFSEAEKEALLCTNALQAYQLTI